MSYANRIQPNQQRREAPPLAPASSQPGYRQEHAFLAGMALCGESTGEFITRSGFGDTVSSGNHYSNTADCNEVRALGRLEDTELAQAAGFGSRGRHITLMVGCSMLWGLLVPLVF